MKYVVITGCAGFIGSHFTEYFLKFNKNFKVIGVDKMNYASNAKAVEKFKKIKNLYFLKMIFLILNQLTVYLKNIMLYI